MSFLTYNFRRAVTACALCTTALVGIHATPAQAAGVDEMQFELDGNIVANGKTDWASLFDVSGTNKPTPKATLPADFGRAAFFRDFDPASNKDSSTFTTGSKDTLNILTGWQCVTANNVNDKIDVLNAYATVYADPDTGHIVLYFGQEVASNEGTKNVGFWFLKDAAVGCVAGAKASSFTGNHSDGDLLIVSEFTNGGVVSTVQAYKWEGGADGFLNPTPIASGAECSGSGQDICARVNTQALLAGTDLPWLTKTKTSKPIDPDYRGAQDLDTSEFFEGGIDLTANNVEGCFTRYLADTRSSTSLTATIFDYVLGDFSICRISVDKTCQKATVDTTDRASFLSPFNVAIKNEGIAQVYDVTLKDTIPSGAGITESCSIISVNGVLKNPPVALPSGSTVAIVDTLAKGDTVNVGISCDGNLNSFANAVLAVAGSTDGGTDLSANDNVTETEIATNQCQAAPAGSLTVDKVCKGMSLVNNNGLVGLAVKVAVTVENNGAGADAELVEGISVVDNKAGNLATKAVLCSDLTTATTFSGSLLPGAKACFATTYAPAAADLVNPPSTAAFTDMVTVNGTGKLSQQAVPTQTDTATCNLCDFDLDGKPDVTDPAPNDPNVQ